MTKIKTNRLDLILGASVRAAMFKVLVQSEHGFASAKMIWEAVASIPGFERTSRSHVSKELRTLEEMGLVEAHSLSSGVGARLWAIKVDDPIAVEFANLAQTDSDAGR